MWRATPYKEWQKEEQPCYSVETIVRIIERSPRPYNTVWRLVAETGIRRGEICGLNVGDLDVNQRIIAVQRSRTKNSKLKAPKAGTSAIDVHGILAVSGTLYTRSDIVFRADNASYPAYVNGLPGGVVYLDSPASG